MSNTVFESAVRPLVKTNIYSHVDLFVRFLQSEKSPSRELPIFVGESWPVGDEPIIYYNCEQLTRNNIAVILKILRRGVANDVVEIWDYSTENVSIWTDCGYPVVRHVPLQTPDDYVQRLREFRSTQPILWDVGFCGSIYGARRKQIFDGLEEAGLSVRIVRTSGEERDRELAQCHIMVNIHYASDYKVWESHRCQAWLDVGVPVVSEHSLDDHPGCINVPFENLVEECVRQVQLAKKGLSSSH